MNLTREYILGLDAGHEINRLVAEHLFKTQPCPPGINNGCRRTGGLDWDELAEHQPAPQHEWGPRLRNLRNFSGDITPAVEVVSHLQKLGCHIQITTLGKVRFGATVVEPDKGGGVLAPWPKRCEAASDSLELTICQAGLLMVLGL